jgi:histidinol-phosphate aminotransferase
MSVSRRDLLSASALLLAGPAAMLRAAAGEAAVGGGGPVVLCWNENPYGPSPAARSAIGQAIAEGCRYPPDEEIAALTAALAAREDLAPNHIVIGTGSGELLRALGLLYGRDGGEIIAAHPTYGELTSYAQHWGAAMKFVPVVSPMRGSWQTAGSASSPAVRASPPS